MVYWLCSVRSQKIGSHIVQVAKWAGLTSSVFSFAQSLTAVAWGKAADRYGRKPILISGLICTMVCFIIWGMSTSLPMAITIRAIQGGSNGNGQSYPTLPDRLTITQY
jgi:MFS family permease